MSMFEGLALDRVVLPASASTSAEHILALELYRDGLIVRFVTVAKPGESPLENPLFAHEARFALTDDLSTPYEFEGATIGGRPTSHGMSVYTPAVPAEACWLEVSSPAAEARFEFK